MIDLKQISAYCGAGMGITTEADLLRGVRPESTHGVQGEHGHLIAPHRPARWHRSGRAGSGFWGDPFGWDGGGAAGDGNVDGPGIFAFNIAYQADDELYIYTYSEKTKKITQELATFFLNEVPESVDLDFRKNMALIFCARSTAPFLQLFSCKIIHSPDGSPEVAIETDDEGYTKFLVYDTNETREGSITDLRPWVQSLVNTATWTVPPPPVRTIYWGGGGLFPNHTYIWGADGEGVITGPTDWNLFMLTYEQLNSAFAGGG